jgi:transcriptional regulator with XRE-family HTH domain
MKVAPNIKAADLQRLGVSKPYSHQLLAGGKTPSLALAQRLERELGIPTSAWPLPPKRPANDASAQGAAA